MDPTFNIIKSFKLDYTDSHRRAMIAEVLDQYKARQPVNAFNNGPYTTHNFEVKPTIDFNRLYKNFEYHAMDSLNKFSLSKENQRRCWAFVSSRSNAPMYWHNHKETSTINGVYYLKVNEDERGILFAHQGKEYHYMPKNNDLIIFPNYLKHLPLPSLSATRISINMEITTNEDADTIFSVNS